MPELNFTVTPGWMVRIAAGPPLFCTLTSPVTMYGKPKLRHVVFALAVDPRTSTALFVLPVAVIPDTVPNATPASWLIANPVLFVIEIVCNDGVTGAWR